MAVEDIANPIPAIALTARGSPSATPMPATAAMVATTCTPPRPKIVRRSAQTRCGLSSRPMRNSRSTTPNSENCSTVCGSAMRRRPQGPIAMPATR